MNFAEWIEQNPKMTASLLGAFLVTVGIIVGLTVATNIYNDGMTKLFEGAAVTHYPVTINDRLYLIQEIECEPVCLNMSIVFPWSIDANNS